MRTEETGGVIPTGDCAGFVFWGHGLSETPELVPPFLPRPAVEQREALARHAGAARFAFNQCLRIVKNALTERKTDPGSEVPWTGFDLINAFNAWKKTEDAGRVMAVDDAGAAEVVVTGLAWRSEVCQQIFEEAAVDLGKGLKAWSDSRSGKRTGKRAAAHVHQQPRPEPTTPGKSGAEHSPELFDTL